MYSFAFETKKKYISEFQSLDGGKYDYTLNAIFNLFIQTVNGKNK